MFLLLLPVHQMWLLKTVKPHFMYRIQHLIVVNFFFIRILTHDTLIYFFLLNLFFRTENHVSLFQIYQFLNCLTKNSGKVLQSFFSEPIQLMKSHFFAMDDSSPLYCFFCGLDEVKLKIQ